jgi:hypothetical protein
MGMTHIYLPLNCEYTMSIKSQDWSHHPGFEIPEGTLVLITSDIIYSTDIQWAHRLGIVVDTVHDDEGVWNAPGGVTYTIHWGAGDDPGTHSHYTCFQIVPYDLDLLRPWAQAVEESRFFNEGTVKRIVALVEEQLRSSDG